MRSPTLKRDKAIVARASGTLESIVYITSEPDPSNKSRKILLLTE